jgi:EmrB/QacA subfamily drug resistance transporter
MSSDTTTAPPQTSTSHLLEGHAGARPGGRGARPRQLPTGLPTELPPNAGRAATGIAIVLVAQLMLVLDATVVNVALPRIDADLGFGPAALSWVLNAYTLAFGGLLLLGGRLGDVRGRLRLFETGLALFTLASALGGLAQTPGQLVAARAAQGVGAALAAPSVLALLTTSAPDEAARHRALALFAAVSSGGASLGLLLGGVVTDLGSWRWTLFLNVPIGLAVLVLARRFVDETARRPGRFDVVGAATATLGAVALVWALIGTPEHGWTSARTLLGFAAGVVLLGVLAVTERRVEHPLVRPALLRSRRRVAALTVMALVVGGQLSMFFLVVQYVQRVLGLGPLASGLAFLPLSLGIFAMSRVTPRLVALVGPGALVMTGTLGLTASFVLLSGVGAGDGYLGAVLGPMLLNGLSAGLVFMPVTATALADVDPEHAGSASGLLQTTQQLGSAVGVAAIVSVYAAGAVPGEFLPGVRAAFLTSAAFAALAFVVATVALRRPRTLAPEATAAPDPLVEAA